MLWDSRSKYRCWYRRRFLAVLVGIGGERCVAVVLLLLGGHVGLGPIDDLLLVISFCLRRHVGPSVASFLEVVSYQMSPVICCIFVPKSGISYPVYHILF